MFLGNYPFLGDTLQDTYDKIVNDELDLPSNMDPLLKNLIEGLLCKAIRVSAIAVKYKVDNRLFHDSTLQKRGKKKWSAGISLGRDKLHGLKLVCNANPASFGQGFQQTLPNSYTKLQNQLRLEAGEQDYIRLEHQPLSLINNMFNARTSSTIKNRQTTSNASQNGHKAYINLELQLSIKPPSP
ncbi:hypothetical protein POM88_006559 [Heracleum sosnowskyi]|uniref:Uncharacterized protein n=1 Tax=Heracleum sosnowskyi TaxID=360622 RepID=A0AAD8J3Q4_9APIA|nr:hypothetical protein POM88_006559 [Heracleum sosnowskyi]